MAESKETPIRYYPNKMTERLISHLGLHAYYNFLQQLEEKTLILNLIIDQLDNYNRQLKEAIATQNEERKREEGE